MNTPSRMPLTPEECAVLKAAEGKRLLYKEAPAECGSLAELGLLKATFGGYRITSSGQEWLANEPQTKL